MRLLLRAHLHCRSYLFTMNTPRSYSNAASSVNGPSTSGPSTHMPNVNMESMLSTLNTAQRRAVTHDPSIPLQILAGPGSGKTKVLISRIARLIIEHKLEPSSICAVTFTNKAANEMRDRLTKLIGKEATTALQMGTFHSICARFLRRYAGSVELDSNFTICDADDSKKLINELLKPYKDYMLMNNLTMSDGAASSIISKAKAKGMSAAMVLQDADERDKAERRSQPSTSSTMSTRRILAEVYVGYETVLKENNALDFDDLLIYGVKLFQNHDASTLWCNHILVDEFQDTNTMQYELMTAIATRRCVTIVGDPDQSIYGWRSAEVINLSHFSPVEQIFLETNYRSTSSILRSCLAIVAEDKKRIPKSLNTTHPLGSTPYVGVFLSEKEEATFIASEIKRCVANMGGVLKWGDFVILLRFNALSRPIEAALQKEGIPCRILGGHKFFERVEVKDILSYLQLVDNPSFNPAFMRAIKVPARGVGDKTMSEIASLATALEISQLTVVERIHDNKIPDIKPAIKRKIASFIKVIRTLRKLDEENTPPSEMIRKLLTMIDYEEYLRKTQQDWDSRWENVQELITFASESEDGSPVQPVLGADGTPTSEGKEDSKLRQFLQASMLSSEGDNQSEDESKEKVTLSTCHAAKGLEWPVVMIPSVDHDTFPFYRTEDVDEERRLLYVACTRAQSLLYILHSQKRQVAGRTQAKSLSSFVSEPQKKNAGLFSYNVPRFLPEDRAVVSKVLGRPLPNEAEIKRRLEELENNGDRVQAVFQNATGGFSAVTLAGVKSATGESEFNLAPLYTSPDALAGISASFRKDYRKRPFSGTSTGAIRNTIRSVGARQGAPMVNGMASGPVQSIGRSLAQEGNLNPTFMSASSAVARNPHLVTPPPSASTSKAAELASSRQGWSEKPRSLGGNNDSSNVRPGQNSTSFPGSFLNPRQITQTPSLTPSQVAGPSKLNGHANRADKISNAPRPFGSSPFGDERNSSTLSSRWPASSSAGASSPRPIVLRDTDIINQSIKAPTTTTTARVPSISLSSHYKNEPQPRTESSLRGSHTRAVTPDNGNKNEPSSGPEWPVSLGPSGWKTIRLPRPVGRHPIAGTWKSIKANTETRLDELHVWWTGIDPLAFANEGDLRPFSSAAIKEILTQAGFASVENAFVEGFVVPHIWSAPLDLDSPKDVLKLEAPFSTVLGAPIAPLSHPYLRGSVGLVLSLPGAGTALLTCSHVARPPVSASESVPNDSQGPKEYIVLDNKSYDASITAMTDFIDNTNASIVAWIKRRDHTQDPTAKAEYFTLMTTAQRKINHVEALKVNVVEFYSKPEQRVVGSLLHAENVASYLNDWALIKVDGDGIGPDFVGNKLFLGHRKKCQQRYKLLFPEVTKTKQHPEDGYLKATDVVPLNDFEDPPHTDQHGDSCLIVVKNGASSGITIGRANSLESSTRIYGNTHDDTHTSHEFAVISEKGAFSKPGASPVTQAQLFLIEMAALLDF
ncbi:hypothetical protein D9619_004893 [Psilocybe cf. subviscida]|uniref:DNA 3'-5' helicase n=1 Tax=Psilocybe cf. subviscida TaxID=2480587 RepID=A0A8H5BRB8_9AGAR|nr:hypothetical protein D9619_004893 [Psilocybe cf. subviscida]